MLGDVAKSLLDVKDSPPGVGHRIKAHILLAVNPPYVRHYAPLSNFDGSLTIFINPLMFLLMIQCGLLPFILLAWRGRLRRWEWGPL